MPGRHHPVPAHLQAGALPASPPIDDVEQEYTRPEAVPVRQEGPVTVHELPARRAATGTVQVGVPPEATRLFGRDLKRKRLVLIATDKPFLYSTSQAGLANGLGATPVAPPGATLWPINVPLVILNADQVHIACFSGTGTDISTVSYVAENYAD